MVSPFPNRIHGTKAECAPRGLKFVAKNRIERVAAIAKYLANAPYDVVTLQELWVYADYEHVRDSIQAKLPHAKFFYRYGTSITFLAVRRN